VTGSGDGARQRFENFGQRPGIRLAGEPAGRRLRQRGQVVGAGGAGRHGDDGYGVQHLDGPLAVGIEGAERLDGVTEELHPDRVGQLRREDVQDAAADGELAGLGDRVFGGVARVDQAPADLRERDLALQPQLQEPRDVRLRRGVSVQQALGRCDQGIRRVVQELPDGLAALGQDARVG